MPPALYDNGPFHYTPSSCPPQDVIIFPTLSRFLPLSTARNHPNHSPCPRLPLKTPHFATRSIPRPQSWCPCHTPSSPVFSLSMLAHTAGTAPASIPCAHSHIPQCPPGGHRFQRRPKHPKHTCPSSLASFSSLWFVLTSCRSSNVDFKRARRSGMS